MINLLKIILIAIMCQMGTPVFANDSDANVLVRMFAWWNEAINDPNGFMEEGFRRYYTEDATIIINGNERVRGIKNMVEHFRRTQTSSEYVEIILPFEEGFESDDRIFTYHLIRAREEGVDSLYLVMGYAVIEDGKISLVDFLSHEQKAENE